MGLPCGLRVDNFFLRLATILEDAGDGTELPLVPVDTRFVLPAHVEAAALEADLRPGQFVLRFSLLDLFLIRAHEALARRGVAVPMPFADQNFRHSFYVLYGVNLA